ncbi:10730_t:CDS:1, partial [Dentiscutata heterogama]
SDGIKCCQLDYIRHILALFYWTTGYSNLISPIWFSLVPLATRHSKSVNTRWN